MPELRATAQGCNRQRAHAGGAITQRAAGHARASSLLAGSLDGALGGTPLSDAFEGRFAGGGAELLRQCLEDPKVVSPFVGFVENMVIRVGDAHAAQAIARARERDAKDQIGTQVTVLALGAVLTADEPSRTLTMQ